MNLTARDQARWLGLARTAIGAGAILAPGPLLRMWGGGDADTPVGRVFARALGARDLALGLGAVLALRREAPARGWVEAGVLADAGDFLATLAGWRALPHPNARFVLAMAGASAIYGRMLAPRLSD